ncbi:sodium-coupled monocarboxylate transporter 2-like [Periplaneta americana]|uniref:sodium-coupled monocarboxylate transporter 2-like n=1 Tax=Periplaneta americana TaxID=6978 RepID=UPI0037E79259
MANKIMKCSVVVVGIVCTSFVYLIENLGNILQIAGSIGGVTYGAMVGLFTFGMVFPRGNSKGALAGSIASMLVMSWVVFGTQRAIAVGDLKHPALPTRIDGCPSNVTIDTHDKSVHSSGQVFILYRISFVYYTAMGTLIMLIVGTIVSLLTEAPDIDKLNPTLFTPFMRKYIEKKRRKKATGPVVHELLEKIHDID